MVKSKALQNVPEAQVTYPGGYSAEQVRLLKSIGGASLDTVGEVHYFLAVCDRLRLDPLKRQIYAVKYQGKLTIQTGIDGYRLLAQRTGVFGGSSAPEWYSEEREEWVDVWLEDGPPAAARVRVYRVGAVEPFVGIAHWKEYAQYTGKGPERRVNSMWSSKPAHMLAKCAEALALRRAFPAEMSGLYTSEETGAWVDQGTGEIQVPEDAYIDSEAVEVVNQEPADDHSPEAAGPTLYNGETIEQISAKLTGMLDGRPMAYVLPVLPDGPNFNARLIAWSEAHPDVPVAAGVFGEAAEYHRAQASVQFEGSDSGTSSEDAKPGPKPATPGKYGQPPRTVGQLMAALGTRADAAGLVWPSDFVASLPKAATLELMVEAYAKQHADEPIVDVLVEEALGRNEGAQGRLT